MAPASDDERLMERLRTKYSQRPDVRQHDQGGGKEAAAPAGGGGEAAGGADERAAAHVRVCGVCHGEGRTQEVYNHRVLQVRATPHAMVLAMHNCAHCGGQGVLSVVEPAAGAGAGQQPRDSSQVEKPRRTTRSAEQLRADVAVIEARLEAFRLELGGVQRHLESGVGGAEGAALGRQLADELESQIARLEASRQARLRALAG
ncbi:hypothetical protein Rsub_10453 [Raphidocelis subcapitata]|uniref:Uncharacterized protein n=1 Tax=Raphidocelis subcapitata TaxID=307507 RepID=A0A2V0PHZ7_9CHLO|nr:hypothetical protein Rsub_10453 [Raphidocelis subcapitata]|eukprot:GBF97530.1 hypothetical protein Rsub_10453 [Raphidocelis subcapitata]